jgi:hypothetical protein
MATRKPKFLEHYKCHAKISDQSRRTCKKELKKVLEYIDKTREKISIMLENMDRSPSGELMEILSMVQEGKNLVVLSDSYFANIVAECQKSKSTGFLQVTTGALLYDEKDAEKIKLYIKENVRLYPSTAKVTIRQEQVFCPSRDVVLMDDKFGEYVISPYCGWEYPTRRHRETRDVYKKEEHVQEEDVYVVSLKA